MDSSLTADQNFYAQSNLHQPFQDENNETAFISGASSELRSGDADHNKELANNSLQPMGMAGYTNSGGAAADLVDSPDDFYKGFQGKLDTTAGIPTSKPTSGQRISSTPLLNSNGTTAKYPVIAGSHTAAKQSFRSVSAPMNDGRAKPAPALKGVPRSQQPSVRDLLKRFDPNGEQASSLPRKTPPRQPPARPLDASNRYRPAASIQKQQPGIRPGQATRDAYAGPAKTPPSRTTQRNRFAVEDQRSNNTLSSAARSPNAKNQFGEFTNGSRSVSNLAISIIPPKPAATDATRKPLFGEIVPTESGSQIAYGISDPRSRARRTSDSSLMSQSWSHRRSSSDVDVSPTSPTAWYLGVTPKLDDLGMGAAPKHARTHNRSQSDFSGFPPSSVLVGSNEMAFMKLDEKTDEKSTPKAASKSRLPISSKRTSHSSASSTPSTRSSSPFATKMIASNKKPDTRPWSPPGHRSTGSRLSARGQGRSPAKISTNNASLKAYISSPPPMKSPPLRSSRPRQPVSAATTASSRNKVSDASSRASSSFSNRAESRIQEKARINRLASAGPVDYAAKRARIQQAFSKTIQETEQKENDQAPLEGAATQNEADLQGPSTVDQRTEYVKEPKLVVDTSFSGSAAPLSKDSPTLGMPGSFPRQQAEIDESPSSAVSNVTAVTLFDNELQTEPAQHHSASNFPQDSTPQPLSSQRDSIGSPDDYFDANDGSIQIVLDDASNGESQFPDFADSQRQVLDGEHQLEPLTFVDIAPQPYEQETESTSFVRASSPHSEFEPGPIISDVHPDDAAALPKVDHSMSYSEVITTSDNDGAVQSDTGAFAPPTSWPSRHSSPSRSSLGLSKLDTLLYSSPTKSPNPPDIEGSPVTEIDYGSSGSVGEAEDVDQHDNHQRASHPSNWSDITVDASNRSSWYVNTNSSSGLFQEPSIPPPPPPKEPILPAKPDVPPKPASYEELFSPRPDGDESYDNSSEFYSSMTDLTGINRTIKPPRSKSTIPPIPAPPPWLAGAPSSPAHSTTRRRTPPPSNVWNRHPPPSLHRYSFKDPESRRVSGDDMYSYRPSTSTARSSAQISVEGDAGETSLSSTDHLSIDAPQNSDDSVAPGAAAAALRHRKMLIQELIDTEAVYLKDMNVVVEIYQGTAEACPKLGTGDIKAIFRNSDEVIAFSERFLADIKASSTAIYIPRSTKSKQADAAKSVESTDTGDRPLSLAEDESDWAKDQKTTVGENFGRHIEEMEKVYANFLKNSEQGTNRLQLLQADPTVNVWLEECNAVAKDLTGAWDLDALLVKPVQRITRYQLLLTGIVKNTPELHPDYPSLQKSLEDIKRLLDNIDGQKKRIHKVNEIVTGRKRKESDIRSGLKNPFTRRERAETAVLHDRANEDQEYLKYCDKFHSEWIHLQFIIRDIDLYLENVTRWVDDFLRYLSAIELVVRASPSSYPELESKWARFNLSMRDVGKVALEEHKAAIREHVLEPFSSLTKAYIPPQAALKKRNKRRPDFQRFETLKSQNKKIDEKLAEQVEQYTALNDTLKLELPKLSSLNENLKDLCLARLITTQVAWYSIWNDKLKTVLEQNELPKDVNDILDKFNRDFKHQDARAQAMSILNGSTVASARSRLSQSTARDDEVSLKSKSRASTTNNRTRGLSTQSEATDQTHRSSEQPRASLVANSASLAVVALGGRPDARLSVESSDRPRPSGESANSGHRSLFESPYTPTRWAEGLPPPEPSFSDAFNSALPWSNTDGSSQNDASRRSSQVPSEHRDIPRTSYKILYVVASLHEFNIEATKTEAGYPYLTYEDGEIFDVIAEKGELWLAKNQDDPMETIGWIWNQHFARMVEY
ncbi:hypothetical protein VE01_01713 [Pseudogymnoascus verrucosus]|uniref:DH domain-containing protein n=1 Tax=Pseudogymnoascus verrucosus TaxID=342668 RepID=A0A1B8GW07_9PEZI|nr:uncharacterized protein VE01_01713 [Pseudogymnoascus verrucosus]OBU00026.1 hypothetical protein VE01_01713 [Pseudogymnoascus verrucosus]